MKFPDPASIMYTIIQKKEAIDRMSMRLNNGHAVFKDVSLEKPKLVPAELGLLRVVSWFYVHYYEVGKVNVDFLSNYLGVYGLDPTGKLSQHLILVDRLRTYFQHNLDPSKPRDRDIQQFCEEWFKSQCGTLEPDKDTEWVKCLLSFLQEGLEFFDSLLKCIRGIEQDESQEQILHNWHIRRSRYHPSHEFDQLIYKVVTDMGRDSLDVVKFRNRYYERWVKEIDSLQGDYDFNFEARRLIEYTLLSDTMAVLPITGDDILNTFNTIEPGPKVGRLLQEARKIYENHPCTKEELLKQLESLVEVEW
ncbi:MAG: hypothetical protein AB1801_14665 [Chloroflexota bacterium]